MAETKPVTVDDVIEHVKDALISASTLGVMTYLSAQFPFFALPVVNQITELAVNKIISLAVNFTELGAYFVYVDLYTAKERADFEEAVAKKANAKTEAEIAAANQAIIEAARKFIRIGA